MLLSTKEGILVYLYPIYGIRDCIGDMTFMTKGPHISYKGVGYRCMSLKLTNPGATHFILLKTMSGDTHFISVCSVHVYVFKSDKFRGHPFDIRVQSTGITI